MAYNVAITPGTGNTVASDEVTDATLGTAKVQYVKIMDGTLNGTTKAAVGANGLASDVKAVVPGTGATNLGKAEDAAHSSGDTGVMGLAVRNDTRGALSGTDGDYTPLQTNSSGDVRVDGSAVTQPVTGAVASGAADSGNPVKIGGKYNATLPTFSDGQRGDAQLTSRGELITADQDFVSSAMNITAADVGSSSTTGEDSQSIITGTATTNSTASISTTGQSSFAVLISGTWVGTVQFERSLDNGTTWTPVSAFSAGTAFNQSTATANGAFHGNASSATNIRVRCTAYTSGTIVVKILAGAGTGTVTVGNPVRLASSSFVAIDPATSTKQSDGSQKTQLVDGSGNVITSTLNSGKQSLDVNLSGATNITTGPNLSRTTGTITATGTGNGVLVNCANFSVMNIKISGTYAGATIAFLSLLNSSGTPSDAFFVTKQGSGTLISSDTPGTNATALYTANLAGPQQFLIYATAISSGSISVELNQTTDSISINQYTQAVQSGTWTINQNQINSFSVNTGNGTAGSGTQRMTIASDNTVLPAVGAGATGSAVPANASYAGVLAQTALPTAATAGNLTGALGDKFGRQVMLTNAIRDIVSAQTTTISSSTSETTIITAAASIFNDLASIMVSNTSATAVRVDFRDTTAGSVLFQLYVPAGDVRGINLTTPWPQTSVNTNWTAQCSASVADVRIAAQFIKNK